MDGYRIRVQEKGNTMEKKRNIMKYMSPYLAGVGLGIFLLLAYVVSGRGLGASGALMRSVVAVEKAIVPSHVDNNTYLSKYGGGKKNPLKNWLIFEVLGVLAGGIISGALAGRIKSETNHGKKISVRKRWFFAFFGGSLFGFGARLARGCTSGVALSGGATLVVGSWITMMCIFAGAYALAYFFRKNWT